MLPSTDQDSPTVSPGIVEIVTRREPLHFPSRGPPPPRVGAGAFVVAGSAAVGVACSKEDDHSPARSP